MALKGGAERGQVSSDSGIGLIDLGPSTTISNFVHDTFNQRKSKSLKIKYERERE
jgi:hypothetical protein